MVILVIFGSFVSGAIDWDGLAASDRFKESKSLSVLIYSLL